MSALPFPQTRYLAGPVSMRIAMLVACSLFALPQTSSAAERNDSARVSAARTNESASPRLIVKRRFDQTDNEYLKSFPSDLVTATDKRGHQLRVDIVEIRVDAPRHEVERVMKALNARSDIEYAVLDRRRHLHAVANDSLYSTQWFLQDTEPAAIAANVAWDTTTGGNGTVVAVLDTGVRFDHPDLQRAAQAGKLLPGYDFVSGERNGGFLAANDGNGWDADPSDPGDWIDSNDRQQSVFSDCDLENSSWHGTRVAGLIGAASNNGLGVAGVSWGAYILPVRVLGKCGGYDSDILPAMRWAAGLRVSGVPDNPYPANVINMSFGSADPCNAAYQSVLQELAALGVTVVTSAGNDGGPVGAPANCPHAIAVAGLRHAGTKVGYSSLGPEVAIAAPAGNCVNLSGACLFSLHTTYDIGRTTPAGYDYTNQFNTNIGTSFSAPLAAGVAALMHSVNARLTSAHLRARLQVGAQPFPHDITAPDCRAPSGPNDLQLFECNCTTTTCGAGMLDASGAVAAAQRPIATIAAPTTFAQGSLITLDASDSAAACNRSVASYLWEVVAAINTLPPPLGSVDQATLQVNAPLSGQYTLRVTVTDNQGAVDSADIVVTSASSTTSATAPLPVSACPLALDLSSITPPPATPETPMTPTVANDSGRGGGGGGGAVNAWLLLVLAILSSARLIQVDFDRSCTNRSR